MTERRGSVIGSGVGPMCFGLLSLEMIVAKAAPPNALDAFISNLSAFLSKASKRQNYIGIDAALALARKVNQNEFRGF